MHSRGRDFFSFERDPVLLELFPPGNLVLSPSREQKYKPFSPFQDQFMAFPARWFRLTFSLPLFFFFPFSSPRENSLLFSLPLRSRDPPSFGVSLPKQSRMKTSPPRHDPTLSYANLRGQDGPPLLGMVPPNFYFGIDTISALLPFFPKPTLSPGFRTLFLDSRGGFSVQAEACNHRSPLLSFLFCTLTRCHIFLAQRVLSSLVEPLAFVLMSDKVRRALALPFFFFCCGVPNLSSLRKSSKQWGCFFFSLSGLGTLFVYQ